MHTQSLMVSDPLHQLDLGTEIALSLLVGCFCNAKLRKNNYKYLYNINESATQSSYLLQYIRSDTVQDFDRYELVVFCHSG